MEVLKLLTVEINKDILDIIGAVSAPIGAIAIPLLIWIYGSARAESKRRNQELRDVLNYLLISAYRYFQYFVNLKEMTAEKSQAMDLFLKQPDEITKNTAFSLFAPPAVDFDIKPSNYAFTIHKMNLISDMLFQFLQVLVDVNSTIDYVNKDMERNFNDDLSMESFIRTAQGHIAHNLPSLIFRINMGMYILIRIIQEVEDYNIYLKKGYKLMAFQVPPDTLNYIQQIENEITISLGHNRWKEPFMKNTTNNQKETWINKIRKNFISIKKKIKSKFNFNRKPIVKK